jgi:predicted PurR-regulated permease PerM
MESLRTVALESVRDTLGHLGKYLKIATKESVFLVIGAVVAVGIFLNPDFEPGLKKRPTVPNLYSFHTARIRERFASFFKCFEIVIGAQLIISAINTALTSIFVYSFSLPYATVVLILTFICGLLPIIGNIISNSIIIGIAFTISPQMAGYALIFLVTIHKLEYFLNSRIIGGRIDHPMWLTLLALIIGERLMGISGMILAPVILSFIKVEMKKIELAPSGFIEPPQLEEPVPRELVETR